VLRIQKEYAIRVPGIQGKIVTLAQSATGYQSPGLPAVIAPVHTLTLKTHGRFIIT
jgi:hypothetical protein